MSRITGFTGATRCSARQRDGISIDYEQTTGMVYHRHQWSNAVKAELITFEWGNWRNQEKLHKSLKYPTSLDEEQVF